MAYTKQTWADLPSKTTPINATRLEHIEDGIFNAAQTADTAASTAGTAAANVGIVSSKVETLTERVNGLDTAVSNKVDKVAGKGLSTNDYDNTDKGKVDSLGTASTKNSTSVVTESSDLVESGAVYQELADNDLIPNKNKLPALLSTVKTLNTGGTWSGNTYTIGSLTLLFEEREGYVTKITVNGSSGNNTITIQLSNGWIPFVGGNYIVSGFGNENARTYVNPDRTTGYYDNGNGTAFTVNTELTCRLQIDANKSFTNIIVQPMIRKATESNPTYEPYYVPLKDIVPTKADNSVIGTVEDGATASQAYAVGEHFIKDGAFCTCIQAIAQGGSFILGTNYTVGDVANSLVYTADYTIPDLSALTWNTPTGSQLSYAGIATASVLPSNARVIGAVVCEPWSSSINVMPAIAIASNNLNITLVIKQSDTPGSERITIRLTYILI